jgi:hypothetical protein
MGSKVEGRWEMGDGIWDMGYGVESRESRAWHARPLLRSRYG